MMAVRSVAATGKAAEATAEVATEKAAAATAVRSEVATGKVAEVMAVRSVTEAKTSSDSLYSRSMYRFPNYT